MDKSKSNKDGNWFAKHKVLTVIIGVVLLFVFVAALSGGEGTKTTTDKTTTSEEVKEEKEEKEEKVPAEYKAALRSAETYANRMNMSKEGIYQQLISSAGDKFTPEAAQYAVDNVDADWNENALKSAKVYQDSMNMSPAAIRDQLTSSAGDRFTPEQADYAIEHLND